MCEELCPIPQKAITFGAGGGHGSGKGLGRGGGAGGEGEAGGEEGAGEAEGDSSTTSAAAAGVKLPRVHESRCIGCGICQYNCPVQGPAAIVVRPVGEATSEPL